MESENCNPYEQQLLSEYESCLDEGQSCLSLKGLKSLCDKLELEERSEELISALLKHGNEDYKISFDEFRSGLLNFLNDTRENEIVSQQNSKVIDDTNTKSTKFDDELRLKQFYANGSTSLTIKNDSVQSTHDDDSVIIAKQSLEQIFQKLDANCDGLITFNEFLLFFQNDKQLQDSVLDLEWVGRPSESANCDKSIPNMLGPEHTGFIQKRVVLNLWQLAGVSDPLTLLGDLNFPNFDINLTELMNVLNEELQSLQHEPKNSVITITQINLLRGALVLYQEEVRSINVIIDQLTRERDKLRSDVIEANERATLLAQEIDENHSKLEKSRHDQIKQLEIKHAEFIKDLAVQYSCDRDNHMMKIKSLSEQLQNLQQEEQQIRGKLAEALTENQGLEMDNQSLNEQISKLKISNNQLLMQVQVLSAEHDEAERHDERENEQIISLVERIKCLQNELSLLRDQNDELTSELEILKTRIVDNKSKHTTISANISDSEESNSVSDYEALSKHVPELKNPERPPDIDCQLSYLPNTIASIINDLKNLTLDRKTTTCTSDCPLRQNVSDIIAELESQIVDTAVDKVDSSMKIKKEEECEERLTASLRDFVVAKNEKTKITTMISSHSDEVINNLDSNTKLKNFRLRDYPPRRDDGPLSLSKSDEDKNSIIERKNDNDDGVMALTDLKQDRDRLSALLEEQETRHKNEKKQLQEQCTKLESDLESLRTEYYQCEDYWANKLEEERQLIEQEQKITDDKLGELIAKIAEYEEQFSINDKSRTDGRLSPIEEKFNLEQQYNDLEEEYELLQNQTQQIITEKENELTELKEKMIVNKVEMIDCQIQVPESDGDKCTKRVFNQSNAIPLSYVLPNELSSTISNNNQAISSITHYGYGQKLFEPGKLNKIAEHSISDNEALFMPSRMINDELPRMQKIELQRLLQKKAHNTSLECNSLLKQKESLIKEIIELQKMKSSQLQSASHGPMAKVDINMIKSLMTKLQIQEKKKKSLQAHLKHQKRQTEKVLEHTWKQHCNEVTDLQQALKVTQDSLKHQIMVNSVHMEKLSKSDLLLKDLYIENTYLKARVESLGERCHVLAHLSSQSTSV